MYLYGYIHIHATNFDDKYTIMAGMARVLVWTGGVLLTIHGFQAEAMLFVTRVCAMLRNHGLALLNQIPRVDGNICLCCVYVARDEGILFSCRRFVECSYMLFLGLFFG